MKKIRQNKNTGELARLVFFFSLFVLVAASLISLRRIAAPLAVSYVFFLILGPFIPRLIKMGLSKSTSLIIIYLGFLFFLAYPIVKFIPVITAESQNFTRYIPKIEAFVKDKYEDIRFEVKKRTNYELKESYAVEAIDTTREALTSFLIYIPKFLTSLLEWVFLIPLFVFFLLKDGDALKHMILQLTPNSIFERFYYLTHQFNKQLGGYIFAKFIEATIVGVIITIGLYLLDVRFFLLFGLIAGITNIIPYVGPLLGSAPGIILVMAEYGMGTTTGGVLLLYLIANAIDIALVFPILVSKIVDLHPIIVVVSVILGSQYFGLVGMIISIPVAAAFKLIINEIYNEIYSARFR
ncbi:MAG: AI-2E family transporter [Bacteriovoracaceae bacterium]|nr:AI-2E family transporter [Bacteriovoracaceae bacterium]